MPLTFAYKWNIIYKTGAIEQVNGKDFGYAEARALLRSAIFDMDANGKASFPGTGALKNEIDNGTTRVISGPHKTKDGDTRQHITVHCAQGHVTFHIYISKKGNCSGISQEPSGSKKPGHVNDDWHAPAVANAAAL